MTFLLGMSSFLTLLICRVCVQNTQSRFEKEVEHSLEKGKVRKCHRIATVDGK